MKHFVHEKNIETALEVALALVVVLLGGLVYSYIRIFSLVEEVEKLSSDFASTTEMFATDLVAFQDQLKSHSDALTTLGADLRSTTQNIVNVQSQLGGVEQTVGNISGTVTTLEKLSKTDPELLQKYSKVFFLNEHYTPERVIEISKEYLYSENHPEVIHAGVWPNLQKLLVTAKSAGITLYVSSAYRSFDEQKSLKSAYSVTYGQGTANQFSADQGYSEHQLGTALDFITTGLGGQLEGFDSTPAYQWLLANAYRFGFTLSYPKGNAFYIFEPWHWRFVGTTLASDLQNTGRHFYDLDQREIDTYLPGIFD